MNEGHTAREQLYHATRSLAAGMGPLKARLRAALTPEVMALRAEDFPRADLGRRFEAVVHELAPDQRAPLVLAQWWDFELSHIAEEIVDIYHQLARQAEAD
ncbi:hypothetical protein [Acidisoma cladoniae]|uniref:hypothetical protein n=1 Tax=Acidisoma cladoniae TaxID=3040935 RepID=UPI00254B6529|nr:hypothetical protein [Acidisoma sp. PAMC 29798]